MKFPSHLNCDGKIVSEMGPRFISTNGGARCHHIVLHTITLWQVTCHAKNLSMRYFFLNGGLIVFSCLEASSLSSSILSLSSSSLASTSLSLSLQIFFLSMIVNSFTLCLRYFNKYIVENLRTIQIIFTTKPIQRNKIGLLVSHIKQLIYTNSCYDLGDWRHRAMLWIFRRYGVLS